jgi:hypothetical protein
MLDVQSGPVVSDSSLQKGLPPLVTESLLSLDNLNEMGRNTLLLHCKSLTHDPGDGHDVSPLTVTFTRNHSPLAKNFHSSKGTSEVKSVKYAGSAPLNCKRQKVIDADADPSPSSPLSFAALSASISVVSQRCTDAFRAVSTSLPMTLDELEAGVTSDQDSEDNKCDGRVEESGKCDERERYVEFAEYFRVSPSRRFGDHQASGQSKFLCSVCPITSSAVAPTDLLVCILFARADPSC